MSKTKFKIACAPLAIAAMAALQTTPAAAQTQPQIVIDVPESQPAPTIVLPDPEPVVSEPMPSQSDTASTVATTGTPEEVVVTRSSSASRAAPAAVAPAEAAPADNLPSTAEPVASSNTELTANEQQALSAATTTTANEAEIAANRAALDPAPQPIDDGSTAALILALLGVGGIGLLAFFLMRRRRRTVDAPVIDRPVVARTAEPAPVLERETVLPVSREPVTSVITGERAPLAGSSNGAAVELPREIPATFEERDTLLRRMIAARPDRANPFKSPTARAKRAKLIMQSLGTSFRNRTPRIDLSQYTNIWPELRGWRPATA